jgi:hypothetical protein
MELLQLAIGLIRQIDNEGHRTWLAVWDERRNCFDFVSSERIGKETFREAVTREIAWVLDVDRSSFLVSNMAQLNLQFDATWPETNESQPIAVSFYNIDLYRRKVREDLQTREGLVWLTAKEIYAGRTVSGLSISSKLCYLINHSKVIQHWESG